MGPRLRGDDELNLRVRRGVESIALPDRWANYSDLFRTVVRFRGNDGLLFVLSAA